MLTILINTILLKKVLQQNQCHIYSLFPMSLPIEWEQPDFMKNLYQQHVLDISRYSLILRHKNHRMSDDQIWSNSKFKLALKVQDKQA